MRGPVVVERGELGPRGTLRLNLDRAGHEHELEGEEAEEPDDDDGRGVGRTRAKGGAEPDAQEARLEEQDVPLER